MDERTSAASHVDNGIRTRSSLDVPTHTGRSGEGASDRALPQLTISTVLSPTTGGLLSPHSPAGLPRGSLDVPSSPTHTDDGSSMTAPPSPTLSSRSSVHFQSPTSLALRDNPQPRNPSVLLSPLEGRNHRRKGSNATFATVTDMTEPGRQPRQDEELRHLTSNTTSERKGDHIALETDIDPTPFRFRPNDLAMMLDPKNMDALELMGGIPSLLEGLGTTADMGLRGSSLAQSMSTGPKRPGAGMGASQRHGPEKAVIAITYTDPEGGRSTDWNSAAAFAATLDVRRRIYGENVLPHRATKSLLSLMYAALRDKVLVLLLVAAVVSLALGLFQDFGTPIAPGEPKVDWVEGVAIMVAILIVVVVGSVNDWQKERQFQVLNDKKEERGVKVIRGGVETVIDIKQVVVGDIALLEPGEIVPCDGVFLGGHNLRCDESAVTGESDAIKKLSFDECSANRESAHTDCFVISGSKVLEGVGKYVVVAVGSKSFNGKIMMALRGDADNTLLQIKLNAFAELIAKLGSAAGLILFTALLIRFFVQLGTGEPQRTANQKGLAFVNILIISVTLIVVAVPEGLPLAVTLALAFATKRMTYEKLLVRILGSCETMANASVVCTDKTGTLTQNSTTVVAGSVGIHAKFARLLENNEARTNADGPRKHLDDFSLDQAQLNTALSLQLRDLFNEAIAVNSTAFQDKSPETGELMFVGSKTETALLKFAQELQWPDFKATRDAAVVLQMIPFSRERKAMGVVVKTREGKFRLYLKGASEILSKKCVSHVVVHRPGTGNQNAAEEIETAAIDELANDNITRTTIFYTNQTLRTIALCYRDLDTWPPNDAAYEHSEVLYDDLARDLTLIGIVGIEDPLRPGVVEAVKKCQTAGVTVKMCTGDNVLTARSIATQCGIFTAGGIIMEGPVFRDLSPVEKMEIVPRLQVLARSSPEDKRILVETLRQIGEIVGVTGDGTNDGPALKTAHVGFSMGIAGTEVAKEASDIILMDDNFASIVKAIMWGRCVNDAVRKFLQFQVSTNATAVVITFVTAIASTEEASVLTAVQLLWINIIMDTFAALALATDPATEALLNRKPDKKTAPLFSVDMYKQIMFQSLYQITVTLIFHFLGSTILGFHDTTSNRKHDLAVQTLVFNAFVFAQIFNSVNCRRLDRNLNIFEGILKNYYFMAITLIEMGVQIIIVFVGGSAFSVTPMGGREWGISLALGVVSIPLGALIRLMPSEPFEVLFRRVGLLGKTEILPSTAPNPDTVAAIRRVSDNLNTFANVRGGRVRSSSFVVKSRTARFSQDRERPASLLAMTPTLMMGTIAANYAWTQPRSLSDPTQDDPSRSSAALWEGKLQLHPDTPPEDPLFQRLGGSRSKVYQSPKPAEDPLLQMRENNVATVAGGQARSSFSVNNCRAASLQESSHSGEASFKNSSFPDAPGSSIQGTVVLEGPYPFAGGGHSNIYKGKWTRSNGQVTQVAIKMILSNGGFEQSSDSLRRLKREASVWEQLKHENLVPFFGISYDVAPWPVLVSPFHDFGHVGAYLKTHATANRPEIVLGVASGVEYLHANDIVHGDLKVSNVLVDTRGVPCISDFGISKILNRRGFTTPNVGTLPYMAPELFWIVNSDAHQEKYPSTTKSSDVYSFGLLALEILTSEAPKRRPTRPFATKEMFAELRPKRTDYENAFRVSDNTWAVLDKCWAFTPEVRPDISDVRQQLSSAFTGTQLL